MGSYSVNILPLHDVFSIKITNDNCMSQLISSMLSVCLCYSNFRWYVPSSGVHISILLSLMHVLMYVPYLRYCSTHILPHVAFVGCGGVGLGNLAEAKLL